RSRFVPIIHIADNGERVVASPFLGRAGDDKFPRQNASRPVACLILGPWNTNLYHLSICETLQIRGFDTKTFQESCCILRLLPFQVRQGGPTSAIADDVSPLHC